MSVSLKTRFHSAHDLWVYAALLGLALHAPALCADESAPSVTALKAMSLEDLLHSDVTAVLNKPSQLFEAPTAVTVITGDDIRRSGAHTIADVLRFAPGLAVVHFDQSTWNVDARGIDSRRNARGLQVLVDGRSVYSPGIGSAYWDAVDYLLEDIDRIEVIRGPGGAVWGANAVDGVINIVTKDASATKGGYLSAGAGNVEQGFGSVRYGTGLGTNAALRVYAKYFNIDEANPGQDGWDHTQTGFRSDWTPAGENHLTLQGDYYYNRLSSVRYFSRIAQTPTQIATLDKFDASGGDLLFHWSHDFGPESQLNVQTSYDRVDRNGQIPDDLREDNYDFQIQHRVALPLNQDFQYGLEYRYYPSTLSNQGDPSERFEPSVRHEQLFAGFVQDEIGFFDRQVRLVLGTRLDHYDATGWDAMPDLRLSWVPSAKYTTWFAVSRGVRIPDRTQRDIIIRPLSGPLDFPGAPLPVFLVGGGNPDSATEKMIAYEMGQRWFPTPKLSFDLSLFYNDYTDLITGNINPAAAQFVPTPFPHLEVPVTAVNTATAQSYGLELTTTWQAQDWWRLSAFYGLVSFHAQDPLKIATSGNAPQNQIGAHSAMDLPHDIQFDAWVKYVGNRPNLGISSYVELDLRLAWEPTKHLEVALVGRNLISPQRYEATVAPFFPSEITPVDRAGFLEITYRF